MILNNDDLQRMRDAIAMGWDWTHCYDIDFEAAITELLDDALEGGESLASKVLAEFPDTCGLQEEIEKLKELVNADDGGLPDENIEAVIDRLKEIKDEIDAAKTRASELIL